MSDQNVNYIGQHHKFSENVTCPTVVSCSVLYTCALRHYSEHTVNL